MSHRKDSKGEELVNSQQGPSTNANLHEARSGLRLWQQRVKNPMVVGSRRRATNSHPLQGELFVGEDIWHHGRAKAIMRFSLQQTLV